MNNIKLVPHISEKSFNLAQVGKYVFSVGKINKLQIKQQIEKIFKVSVIKVNVISIPGKVKRNRQGVGRRSDIRKAIVSLKKGDRIDLFEVETGDEGKKKDAKDNSKDSVNKLAKENKSE